MEGVYGGGECIYPKSCSVEVDGPQRPLKAREELAPSRRSYMKMAYKERGGSLGILLGEKMALRRSSILIPVDGKQWIAAYAGSK